MNGPHPARPSAETIAGNGAGQRRAAPLVAVEDLAKHFPLARGVFLGRERGQVHAVDGVSFEIPRGGTLGLVGESGCGKSTVARLVTRLLEPSAGRITYDGKDITHWKARALRPLRREMQLVFQDPYSSLNPRRTVGAIVAEPLRLQGIGTRSERRTRVREMLEVRRPEPRALQPLPARVLGRPATADRDRASARHHAQARRRGRARLGARRLDPGADPQPARRAAGRVRAHVPVHRARPERRAARLRPDRRDVPREDRRALPRGRAPCTADPPVHGGAPLGRADGRDERARAPAEPGRPPRRPAEPRGTPFGLPLPHALPLRNGDLQRRRASPRPPPRTVIWPPVITRSTQRLPRPFSPPGPPDRPIGRSTRATRSGRVVRGETESPIRTKGSVGRLGGQPERRDR